MINTMPLTTRAASIVKSDEDPIAAAEREEIQKTCNENNDIIRQILKDTA